MSIYRETDHNIVREYSLEEPPFHLQTNRATVDLVKTREYGEALFVDGELQLTEQDEYLYHEMLIHPCLAASSQPLSICIIGGGDGCAARECLKWDVTRSITVIDWDSELTNLFKTRYGYWNGYAYDNPKVSIETANILDLQNETRSYNCVVIDLLDPEFEQLWKIDFWNQLIALALRWRAKHGTIVINAGGITPWSTETLNQLLELVQKQTNLFVHIYKQFVPSFGREWCFLLLSDTDDLYMYPFPESTKFLSKQAWKQAYSYGWTKDFQKGLHLNIEHQLPRDD